MKNLKFITDYIYDNYYNDKKRLARTPLIPCMIIMNDISESEIKQTIDKLALFFGINKSCPPKIIAIEA